MFRPNHPRQGPGRDVLLLYLLAALTTVGHGSMELILPLDLARRHDPLPLIGGVVATMSVGSLLSRIPAGAAYTASRARVLNATGHALLGLATIGLAAAAAWQLTAALSALHGVAFGLVTTFQLAMLIEARSADRPAGPMLAWYTAATSAGYAVGAPLAAEAIVLLGHPGAFVVSGLVNLGAAALTLTFHAAHRSRPAAAGGEATPGLRRRDAFRLPAEVWLATLLAFYINFLSDAIGVFFPVYAVASGLSVTLVGALRSINSIAATTIRFAVIPLFRTLPAGPLNHLSVMAMAAAALAVALTRQPLALGVAFIVLGLGRGVIRVTSATTVAEQRERLGPAVGVASGVYNSGLDAGSIAAPPVTGVIAESVSVPFAFQSVAVALPALYYGLWGAISLLRRGPRSTPTRAPSGR